MVSRDSSRGWGGSTGTGSDTLIVEPEVFSPGTFPTSKCWVLGSTRLWVDECRVVEPFPVHPPVDVPGAPTHLPSFATPSFSTVDNCTITPDNYYCYNPLRPLPQTLPLPQSSDSHRPPPSQQLLLLFDVLVSTTTKTLLAPQVPQSLSLLPNSPPRPGSSSETTEKRGQGRVTSGGSLRWVQGTTNMSR